jgi:hypothetical protein
VGAFLDFSYLDCTVAIMHVEKERSSGSVFPRMKASNVKANTLPIAGSGRRTKRKMRAARPMAGESFKEGVMGQSVFVPRRPTASRRPDHDCQKKSEASGAKRVHVAGKMPSDSR